MPTANKNSSLRNFIIPNLGYDVRTYEYASLEEEEGLNRELCNILREAAKKVLFFSGPATKEKNTFFNVMKKFLWPLSRGGGG